MLTTNNGHFEKYTSTRLMIVCPIISLLFAGAIVFGIIAGIANDVELLYIAILTLSLIGLICMLAYLFYNAVRKITITPDKIRSAVFNRFSVLEYTLEEIADVKVFLSPYNDKVVVFSPMPVTQKPLTRKEISERKKAEIRIACTNSEYDLLRKLINRPIRNIITR